MSQSFKKLNRKVEPSNPMKEVLNNLCHFFNTLKLAFYEVNIQKGSSEKEDDQSNLEIKRDLSLKGTYLQVRCGHNGTPNKLEAKFLANLIALDTYK